MSLIAVASVVDGADAGNSNGDGGVAVAFAGSLFFVVVRKSNVLAVEVRCALNSRLVCCSRVSLRVFASGYLFGVLISLLSFFKT